MMFVLFVIGFKHETYHCDVGQSGDIILNRVTMTTSKGVDRTSCNLESDTQPPDQVVGMVFCVSLCAV